MTPTPELTRAGIVEVAPGVFDKARNEPTNLRPRAAKASRKTNLHSDRPGETAKLERDHRHGPLGEGIIENSPSKRVLVRVTSYRRRLLDFDNLCEKFFVDCCRYSGLIHGDSPATTQIEVCQEKAEPGAIEETKIEIYEICPD